RVVPRLAVGERLVELADEIRGLVRHLPHAPRGGVVERAAFPQQHPGGDIVANPDRFEVGREEQPARPQHVVLVGVLPIAPGVSPQDLRGPGPRGDIASERRERRKVGRALGQPQVLQTRPVAVVPLAALDLAAAITGAGLSPVTKNMPPPAPEPAALPPSAPAAVTACSSRAISGVRISGSSACWCFQFSVSSAATRVRLAERTASAMRSATSFMARSASVTPRSPRPYAAITRAMVAPDMRDRPV